MKNIVKLLFFIYSCVLVAQDTPIPYFQQEVNYNIQVTLNDNEHSLEGIIEMEYTNNSPQELSFIYMHLWPNAYKDTETPFAIQQLENGATDFYFSRPSERGYITDLNFTVNNQAATYQKEAVDYGKLMLNEPLKAGETIKIKTPFKVKIPKSFSRLGHVEQSYQLTQWYPKPAVYDREGWHPMSYLDQGEFYSEYGCFDVKITLPKNYIVGASGDLQNQEEIDFLNQKAKETKAIQEFKDLKNPKFPESSAVFKTLEYKQCNVHDFAWFADKRFHVLKGEAIMPESGRKVDLWSMFTDTESNLWANSLEYIHDGLLFYSQKVGEYPYNQCTAVQSALSAGAGMEYPQITVIGLSGNAEGLEAVIVHEVGHNWFYGQLGFNERKYPFMDEGYNTYYDQRYTREKYPEKGFTLPTTVKKLLGKDQIPARDVWELVYQTIARNGKNQAVGLPSEDFTATNYGALAYTKTGISIDYLAAYLGQDKFDKIMQEIYKRWEFKHPQPKDFKRAFSEFSLKELDWFFDDLIFTDKKLDYQIWKLDQKAETIGKDQFDEVMVLNHPRNIEGPYTISAIKNDKEIHRVWYSGFKGNEKVLFPSMDYDKLVIDYPHFLPEYNRKNNTIKAKGLFKKMEPLKLRLLGNIENPDKTQLFLLPAMAYNVYDGFQLGLATYNALLPSTKFEYSLAAMYGFESKSATGLGQFAYNLRPNSGVFSLIRPNLAISTFGDGNYAFRVKPADATSFQDFASGTMRYMRFAPEIKFDFRKKTLRSKQQHSLTLRHINLQKNSDANTVDVSDFSASTQSYNGYKTERSYYLNQVMYNFENKRKIMPYNFGAMLEQHTNFMKTAVQADLKVNYPNKGKGLKIRAFAGAFLWENDIFLDLARYKENDFYQFGLNSVGANDYAYHNLMVGRHQTDGTWNRQINSNNFNGGFKSANAYKNGLNADKWVATVNLEVESPIDIPIINRLSMYLNMGANNRSWKQQSKTLSQQSLDSPNITTGLYENKIMYEMGLALKIIPDAFEVYLPLAFSKDIKDQATINQPYNERISFMLNLNRFNFVKQVRNIEF